MVFNVNALTTWVVALIMGNDTTKKQVPKWVHNQQRMRALCVFLLFQWFTTLAKVVNHSELLQILHLELSVVTLSFIGQSAMHFFIINKYLGWTFKGERFIWSHSFSPWRRGSVVSGIWWGKTSCWDACDKNKQISSWWQKNREKN